MNHNELTLIDPRVAQFGALIIQGIKSWETAGKILCDLEAEDPTHRQAILADNPHLTAEILDNFLRIGRREVYAFLVLDGSPGAKRLAALPYDQQVQLHQAEIPVVVMQGGAQMTRSKRISDLTKPEAERAIGMTGLRPVAEQMRLLRHKLVRDSTSGAGHGMLARTSVPEPAREPAPDVGATPPEDLDETPLAALLRHLAAAQAHMLEARSAMVMMHKRESRQDRHIVTTLQAIGQLRLAAQEGEL